MRDCLKLEDLGCEVCPICGDTSLRYVTGEFEGAEYTGAVCDNECDLWECQ